MMRCSIPHTMLTVRSISSTSMQQTHNILSLKRGSPGAPVSRHWCYVLSHGENGIEGQSPRHGRGQFPEGVVPQSFVVGSIRRSLQFRCVACHLLFIVLPP